MNSLHNPFKVVRMFEETVADYTGAPYAVSVDSCTNALFLCCKYLDVDEVTIPSMTYLSVPQSVMHAGGKVVFDRTRKTNEWTGIYQLKPYPIYVYTRIIYVSFFSHQETLGYKQGRHDTD